MSDEYGTAPAPDPDYNLGDVPDLSGITPDEKIPWEDGWYQATAVKERTFTSNTTGVTTTFASGDEPAKASGRNITVQVKVTRKNGDSLNARVQVNYLPEHLTSEIAAAILKHKEAQKAAKKAGTEVPDWGPLFRPFMAQQRIGTLQRIAGLRQFARNGNGGLDITPLFDKTLFVRLVPQKDKPQYKEVVEFSDVAPKKGTL